MIDRLIVLNGVPGSGKTTLARPLADLLAVPLLQKDAIKEALWDAGAHGLPTSEVGAIAMDTLWRLAARYTGLVMIESFWATGRDERWFAEGYVSLGSPPGVEVWCAVPLDVAVERFRTRPRHTAHADLPRLDEMRRLAAAAQPISGLPVVRVDTRGPVDLTGLSTDVLARLSEPR